MTNKESSNEYIINWEKNGGYPPNEKIEKRNESGDKAGYNHERLEQIRIKYEEKDQ